MTLALSVVFHVLMVFGTWLLTLAVGIEIHLADLAWVVPTVGLISMVPVAINGYGLREASCIYLLNSVGISQPEAAATALLGRAVLLLFSVAGGVLLIGEKSFLLPKRPVLAGQPGSYPPT